MSTPKTDTRSAEVELSAAAAYTEGHFHQAIHYYRALVDSHPERMDIQARLGYLELLANRADQAVTRLSSVLESGYRTRDVLSHLGEAYYRSGDLGHAALCYQLLGREGLAGTLAAMADLDVMRTGDTATGGDLPWIAADPLPVVRAEINGTAANLVIDTGAGDCVLDTRHAIAAEVRLGGQEWRHFADGRRGQVTHAHAAQLDLGNIRILDVPIQVFDLQTVFSDWYPDLTIHGILGVRVMSLFDCRIDYGDGLLSLAPPGNGRAADKGSPFWLAEDWMLLSHADFPALRQALVFLDTGMTGGAFAVSESRGPALGLSRDTRSTLVGTGGGGQIAGTGAHAKTLRLDETDRRDAAGLLVESLSIETAFGFRVNGLIGHDMLRGTRLFLDFANMRLSVGRDG